MNRAQAWLMAAIVLALVSQALSILYLVMRK